MRSATVLLILGVWAVGSRAGVIAPAAVIANDLYAIPNYQSSYSVADGFTGDRKSASETRVGDVVKGSYSVHQPDGVVRTVIYTSSPLTGFQAQVINTGKALHPAIIGGRRIKASPAVALVSPAIAIAAPVAVKG